MKLRNLLLIIGLAGLAIAVFLNLHELKSFVSLLSSLRWYVLVIVIVIQLSSYYLNAYYYQSILRVFDHHEVGLTRLFQAALAANFVNYILPSAGIAGAGFFSQVLSPEVSRGKAVLIQFMRYGLSALAVLIMLPIGIGLIVITRPASRSVNNIAISTTLIVLAVVSVIVVLVHQESWFRRAISWLVRQSQRLFSKINISNVEQFIDDFYLSYRLIVKKKKQMLVPFGWSIVYVLVEMFTLYLSFLAFGKVINPGVVIMAYVMANVSSALGGAVFSIGIFELGMIGTLVALKEPFVLALSITLVYRIMNLIIGLPPGFFYYRKYLPKTKSKKIKTADIS